MKSLSVSDYASNLPKYCFKSQHLDYHSKGKLSTKRTGLVYVYLKRIITCFITCLNINEKYPRDSKHECKEDEAVCSQKGIQSYRV